MKRLVYSYTYKELRSYHSMLPIGKKLNSLKNQQHFLALEWGEDTEQTTNPKIGEVGRRTQGVTVY